MTSTDSIASSALPLRTKGSSPSSTPLPSSSHAAVQDSQFADSVEPISPPPPASFVTKVKLALICAQAIPMLATIKYVARPAPGLREGARESEQNIPRQSDIAARQQAIILTAESMASKPQIHKQIDARTNFRWLSSGFQLILGSGFFGMYQHAGVLRALAKAGLHAQIKEICGLSSGAIAGALYATLGPSGMTKELLELSLLDFLDLDPRQFYAQGALCAGKTVQRKIKNSTSQLGCTRLEDVPGPKLTLAVFDGHQGETRWLSEGDLSLTVARSAALPVLFANDGFLDGGWVDHHGFTALKPHQRALSIRMNTSIEPDTMQKLVQRPKALFNISDDPEHKTVALDLKNKITAATFIFDVDFNKEKQARLINESDAMFTAWLFQPHP